MVVPHLEAGYTYSRTNTLASTTSTTQYYLLTDFYNKALGAGEDLKVLNNVLLRCTPSLPAEKQQVGVVWLLNLLWLLTLATYCGYANHAYFCNCFATLTMAVLTNCHVSRT